MPVPDGREPPLFDLHVHTVASDGTATLLELGSLARRSGLAGLAITDHDRLPVLSQLQEAERRWCVRLLPGVELSTQLGDRRLHLLGYRFAVDAGSLGALCERLQEQRRERWQWMVAALTRRGVRLPADRLRRFADHVAPGRRHLARVLVAAGVATNLHQAFQRFLLPLEEDARAAPDQAKPPAAVPFADAVTALHEAGGLAVLAHPPANLTRLEWQALVAAGLDGLEARFPRANNTHRRFLLDRAAEHQLLMTAGSDYHGDDLGNFLGKETVAAPDLWPM